MPSYPVLVAAGVDALSTGCPPITVAGNLYLIGADSGSVFHIFVSSDGGGTWAELDSAHAPTPGGLGGWCYDSTNNRFAVLVSNFTAQLQFFNLGTETWGTIADTGINVVNPTGIAYLPSIPQLVITAIFSAGHGSPDQAQYMTCNPDASGATAFANIGNNVLIDWICNSILVCTNWVHFVVVAGIAFGGGTRTLYQVPLAIGGALGSPEMIDTITDGGNTVQTGFYGSTDGTNVAITWVPTNAASNVSVFEGTSASSITFSSQVLAFLDSFDCSAIVQGTMVSLLVASDDGTTCTLYLATDSGAGFGSFVSVGSTAVGVLLPSFLSASGAGTAWDLMIDGSLYFFASAIMPPPFVPPPPASIINLGGASGGGGGAYTLSLPEPSIRCGRLPTRNQICKTVAPRGVPMLSTKMLLYNRGDSHGHRQR